jgi:hypothetical protein
MKKIILACLTFFGLVFTGCDRTGNFEVFQQDIPWNFCVLVSTDAAHKAVISGATVEIYKNTEDRDAHTNVFLSKTTDAKGEALFSLTDFDPTNKGGEYVKGIYYLRVVNGDREIMANTYYLLMNSGTTYQYIVFD